MSKQLELSRWEATQRLLLFLKLRKGKTITDKTVKDFDKLMAKMYANFKDHDDNIISYWREKDYEAQRLALKAIRAGFLSLEKGGNYRLSDVDEFAFYNDKKHRVKIKGEQVEITEHDYKVLRYIFLGER